MSAAVAVATYSRLAGLVEVTAGVRVGKESAGNPIGP